MRDVQVYLVLGTHQIRCRILVAEKPQEFPIAILNRLGVVGVDSTESHLAAIGASDAILTQLKVIDPNVTSLFITDSNGS